jgi:eukaryotic-like serine/threonine-protein kinase
MDFSGLSGSVRIQIRRAAPAGHDASSRRMFQRICEAVSFAHAHGVVHRDLKPDNVMVGEFGEALVMDWGIARAIADETPERAVVGTRAFMAPEQVRADTAAIDARTDVYGLGRTLAHLLPVPTKPVASIIAKATAERPEERYASARELAEDIGRFLDGEPVTAHRETVLEVASRFVLRHRALLSLLTVYLAVRVALALWNR